MNRRILYLQYTNPAGYPPLEHSSQLLARDGWEVCFAGTEAFGARTLRLRPHERIRVERLGGLSGGPLGPAKYAAFLMRAARLARAFAPDWIYASDATAAPAAIAIRKVTGARVVYHEHDPPPRANTRSNRLLLRARARIIASAEVLVVPGVGRRELLGREADRAFVVWNCPLRDEIDSTPQPRRDTVSLVYAGSINADRLPDSYIHALAELPPHVCLEIFGFQPMASRDHVSRLAEVAARIGVAERVTYHGALDRRLLLEKLSSRDIGIATINIASGDEGMRSMVGPSNKPFDYMARGLSLLVSDAPDWRAAFVRPGYGVACNAQNVPSIVDGVSALLDGEKRRAIGRLATAKIAEDWNYEHQFRPVMERLSA